MAKRVTREATGETSIVTESATEDQRPDAQEQAKQTALLATMREQLKSVMTFESGYRQRAPDDTMFRAGTLGKKSFQWPESVQEQRELEKRPCMTINRMPAFIRQVTNMARAAKLRIIVSPNDDTGDPKIAETLQGIIRNIEVQSFAHHVAYNIAGEKQAEIGWGLVRLATDWIDETTFRQRLRFKAERDPLQVYIDPASQEPDRSDADFAIKAYDLSATQYKKMFPDVTAVPTPERALSLGVAEADVSTWFPNGTKIRIVEWFNREPFGPKKHIALMDDGRVIPYPTAEQKAELDKIGASILRDRWIQPRKMIWRKADCCGIRETTEWVTDRQPWVPFLGDEFVIDGEIDRRGVVRDAREPAMVYNVEVTALVENVGLGNKSPVIGWRGQFGKPGTAQRKAWETAHSKVHPFLELDPMTIDDKPAPFIGRQSFEPPIEGVVRAIAQADNDLKATAGFFDASLGERGPQESGKAIVARQRQDELGSSHYIENQKYALSSLGVHAIKGIRVVYDTPQVVRIMGGDERPRRVMVYAGAKNDPRHERFQKTHAGPHPMTMADGKTIIMPGQKIPFELPKGVTELYDLSVGEYDVEVSAGPDVGSRRAEALDALTQIITKLPPQIAVNFLDLFFSFMDVPKAQQMAERAKMLLPKELQQQEGNEDIPPAAMQQIMAMKADLEKAGQMLQAAETEIKTERAKYAAQVTMKREELQSREKIAGAQQMTARAKIVADAAADAAERRADAALEEMKIAMAALEGLLARQHETRQAQHDAAHDVASTLLEHNLGRAAAAEDRAHAVASASADDVMAPPDDEGGTE